MFVLCIFYTAWVALGILVGYIFKKNSKFWVVKERPDEPAQLRNEEYGKHKFAHVNVIKKFTFNRPLETCRTNFSISHQLDRA